MRKFIPFWAVPASWGLVGKSRKIAEAEYYLNGEELDRQLLELNFVSGTNEYKLQKNIIDRKYNHVTDYEFETTRLTILHGDTREFDKNKNELDYEFNKIDKYDYLVNKAKFDFGENTKEFNLEKNEIDIEFEKIDENAYNKNKATINDEPYVVFLDAKFHHDGGRMGSSMEFELDWNSKFVEYLRNEGYSGINDEDVVDEWFTALHKNSFHEFMMDDINSMAGE